MPDHSPPPPSALPGPPPIDAAYPALVSAARAVTAVLLSAAVGTGFWLFAMQEGQAGRIFNHRWTQHDFPDGLGRALGATEPARTGLLATFVLMIGVVLVFALIERWLPLRDWRKGIVFAPLIFLAWGLVFCPLVDARQLLEGDDFVYRPNGLFGLECGNATIVSALVASLATGLVIARVIGLGRSSAWWRPRVAPTATVVDRGSGRLLEVPVPDGPTPQTAHRSSDALLELAEQGGEEGGKRTG